MCLQKRGESEAADTFLSTALKPSGSAGHRKILPTTLEIGPWSPLSSEGSGKGFRKFSEWECRTIPTIYAFGPFRLDVQGETLFRDTEPVALSKRAVIGMGHFFARRGEKAVEMFGLSLQQNSRWPPTLRFMASCLARIDHLLPLRRGSSPA